MTEIISVRFKEGGKSYYFNPDGMTVNEGDFVVIETSRGVEFGECVEGNRMIDERELVAPLRPVVRHATEEDFEAREKNKEKEASAFTICQQKIAEHGLDMKLVDVEYGFDGSKIMFFFTSDGRVDFRALVRDLASVFHTRIELRQIGVRDEAKLLGGLGVCGRPYCCSSFLTDFHPVSIKMAKTQNLSLNPTKISGACGRLMCCLKYEEEAYEDVLKRSPKLESLVETPDGVGTVNSVQLLREKVKVRLDNDPDSPKVYTNEEIKVIRSGKGKRPEGYELPDSAENQEHTRHLRSSTPAFEGTKEKTDETKDHPIQTESAGEERTQQARHSHPNHSTNHSKKPGHPEEGKAKGGEQGNGESHSGKGGERDGQNHHPHRRRHSHSGGGNHPNNNSGGAPKHTAPAQ